MQFEVHPNQVTTWKTRLEGGAADVFDRGPGPAGAVPAVDVKALHAKIGQLTLENDFLEGALSVVPEARFAATQDNVFVERRWRSVKHEKVFPRASASVCEARERLGTHLDW